MVPAIQVEQVVKRYGQLHALAGVSLEIERGEFFGLLGPNGAGKTTLISAVCNLIRVTGGLCTSACPISTRRFMPPES